MGRLPAGRKIVLRIKGKGSVYHDVPTRTLKHGATRVESDAGEIQRQENPCPGGLALAGSQFVFSGYSGATLSNRALYPRRLRADPADRRALSQALERR
jgi:hypothetical protein